MTELFSPELQALATDFLIDARERCVRVAMAESCTGGLVSALLTEISGSSEVVDRGFVTYANEAKTELLGVPAALIDAHGAVSEEVARAMAAGALDRSNAQMAVAITGVAGPGGGSDDKPVGYVCFACATDENGVVSAAKQFGGDRTQIRLYAVQQAIELMRDQLTQVSFSRETA